MILLETILQSNPCKIRTLKNKKKSEAKVLRKGIINCGLKILLTPLKKEREKYKSEEKTETIIPYIIKIK